MNMLDYELHQKRQGPESIKNCGLRAKAEQEVIILTLTNEDLSAISRVLDSTLDSRFSQMRGELNEQLDVRFAQMRGELNEQLDVRFAQMRGELDEQMDARFAQIDRTLDAKLDARLNPMERDIHALQDNVNKINLTLENIIIPRLDTIESCYLDTYKRYQKYADKMETAFADIEMLKQVVADHSEKLQKLA